VLVKYRLITLISLRRFHRDLLVFSVTD